MRNGLKFYRSCLEDAWQTSWTLANAWPPVLVLLALYAAGWLSGHEAELATPSALLSLLAAAALAVFLVRFAAAPPRLFARIEASVPKPKAARRVAAPSVPVSSPAPLKLQLRGSIDEADAIDVTGDRLPPARAFMARATNQSDAPLRHCQLFFGTPRNIQVVSAPFDLAPGAHLDLPVLRVSGGAADPHALVYFLDRETWGIAGGQAAWLPEPGRFKVTALSPDTERVALEVELSAETAEWTLAEAPARKGRAAAPAPAAKPGWIKAGDVEGFAPAND
ncbi:MAG: hypothetical protein JSR47_20485 [Proteobacteria bacterium]|nr:hypothetical protein [Pseudomonadota bacterium]